MAYRPPGSNARRRPRNPEPETSASLVNAVVARLGGTGRAAEQRVALAWPEAVGTMLAARTRVEALRGKTMFVRVESSALAHELALLKLQVLERLKAAVGEGVVEDLRTRVGPLGS